jgi:hypothetical protein
MLQRSISELATGAAPARGWSAPDIHKEHNCTCNATNETLKLIQVIIDAPYSLSWKDQSKKSKRNVPWFTIVQSCRDISFFSELLNNLKYNPVDLQMICEPTWFRKNMKLRKRNTGKEINSHPEIINYIYHIQHMSIIWCRSSFTRNQLHFLLHKKHFEFMVSSIEKIKYQIWANCLKFCRGHITITLDCNVLNRAIGYPNWRNLYQQNYVERI